MSFVHLHNEGDRHAWGMELLIHHAGVPLALFVLMQDYRLMMGTRFGAGKAKDLYAFWGDRIAEVLNADLKARNLRPDQRTWSSVSPATRRRTRCRK